MKTLVLYMPVLHRGYLDLFDRVKPQVIALLTEDVLRHLPEGLAYIAKKDVVRALQATEMRTVLTALLPKNIVVTIIDDVGLRTIDSDFKVIMPDEDVSVAIVEMYYGGAQKVSLVTPPSRLRYHRDNVEEKKLLVPDRRSVLTELDLEIMALANSVVERSPDWWRQVGGVLVAKDGRCIVAYNEHLPHEQIAATFGDPRSIFKSGVRADISHSDHTEHIIVGEAARTEVGTDGSTLYLTTFPCLPCSRLIARAGVKRLFYRDASYGLLDADEYLRIKQIELIEVS